MKRLKMATKGGLTLEEGCNKYLDNCRQCNHIKGKESFMKVIDNICKILYNHIK